MAGNIDLSCVEHCIADGHMSRPAAHAATPCTLIHSSMHLRFHVPACVRLCLHFPTAFNTSL
eukprot:scaffold177007_cov23-Tisochrysis_lutea.AAC.2